MRAAGVLNLGLAAAVWLLAPGRDSQPVVNASGESTDAGSARSYRLLLAVAFLDRIGLVHLRDRLESRMLALVLGSSTHSFELMLASFIAGLAFGGLWVRKRIDALGSPLRFLGVVQVAMGARRAPRPCRSMGTCSDLMQAVMKAWPAPIPATRCTSRRAMASLSRHVPGDVLRRDDPSAHHVHALLRPLWRARDRRRLPHPTPRPRSPGCAPRRTWRCRSSASRE